MDITYRIVGLPELLRAEQTVGAKTEGLLTTELLKVGEHVAGDVRSSYQPYSPVGAAGVKSKVFTSGLYVVQTLNKSRNVVRQRPNFGPMIFRKAFLPAVRGNQERVKVAADLAVREATVRYWDMAA